MKRRFSFSTTVILIALACVLCGGREAMGKPKRDMTGNMVVNGRFQDPMQEKGDGHAHGFPAGTSALTGWTVSGGGIDVLGDMDSRRVNLGASTVLSQKLNLVKGKKYEVGLVAYSASAGTEVKSGVVRIAGQTLSWSIKQPHYEGDPIWTEFKWVVTGTGPTTLEVASTNGEEHGPHVADVLVREEGIADRPIAPAEAVGTVVDVQGDMFTINQSVKVEGKTLTLKTKYYTDNNTKFAEGFKLIPGSNIKMVFRLGTDGRKMVKEIGPR